jgi:mycothiol synthase
MTQPIIRGYGPGDEAALLRVWNRGLHADPINATTWRAKVLLDPNFDKEGCLIAEVDGEVRGFLLSLVRLVPFFNDGLELDRSWMTAFAVDPGWQLQGIGRALLATTLMEMLKKNYHAAWFMSTGEDAARLYAQLDFHEVRRFVAMTKEL